MVGLLEAKGRFAVLRTGELKIRNRQICKAESKRTISIIVTGVQLKIKDKLGLSWAKLSCQLGFG